jgi:hypothetical protein
LGSDFVALTENDFISDSKSVDINALTQISRVIVYYNPIAADPKTSGDDARADYSDWDMYVDRGLESDNAFDENRVKTIYAPWLYTELDAHWLATHYFNKYCKAIPLVDAQLELQYGDLSIAQICQLTVNELVDFSGNALSMMFKIIGKVRKSASRYLYNFEAAGISGSGGNYATIGPINGVLDANINDIVQTIDIDISLTGMTIADWKIASIGQIIIGSEKISYTTITNIGAGIIRLNLCTRGVDGTANVAHTAGVDCIMLASSASDSHKSNYGFIGNTGDAPTGNLIDFNGDLVNEAAGYLTY